MRSFAGHEYRDVVAIGMILVGANIMMPSGSSTSLPFFTMSVFLFSSSVGALVVEDAEQSRNAMNCGLLGQERIRAAIDDVATARLGILDVVGGELAAQPIGLLHEDEVDVVTGLGRTT